MPAGDRGRPPVVPSRLRTRPSPPPPLSQGMGSLAQLTTSRVGGRLAADDGAFISAFNQRGDQRGPPYQRPPLILTPPRAAGPPSSAARSRAPCRSSSRHTVPPGPLETSAAWPPARAPPPLAR